MRKDIDFSFRPHPLNGDLSTKSGSTAIRQSIINLIKTNFGDRGFNIELASNLTSKLFENMTLLTANSIRDNIRLTIENFEPQVELVDVEVYDNQGSLAVKIYYTELNNSEIVFLVVEMTRIR